MPTIKTQIVSGQRRIISKLVSGQKRISCSCCDEQGGCCMYPADQFGILYQMEDLPEELKLNLYDNGNFLGTFTAIKNETENGIYFWNVGGGVNFAIRHEDEIWNLYTSEFSNEEPPTTDLGGQNCLIDDPDFNVLPVFEDNFADTYGYEVAFGGDIIETGTITRVSLCIWESGAQSLFRGVVYDGGAGGGDGEQCEWSQFDSDDLKGIKTPPHNSPVGEYIDSSGGLYNGAVTTVFE